MAKISKRTVTVMALCAPFIAACVKPLPPLPENDPVIAQAVDAFEAGCMNTGPGFVGAKEAWRARGVSQIKENGTTLPYNIFGLITRKGHCAVGVKGEARAALESQLLALMQRRGVRVIEERRDQRTYTYGGHIEYQSREVGVAVSARPFGTFGFWSFIGFVPDVDSGKGVF